MKKTFDLWVHLNPTLKKLLMELKIAMLIITASVSTLFANPGYSQVAKVSIDMKNSTIEQVMDVIEAQSEFYFIFNQKQIDVDRIVDIEVDNELISNILPELFQGTNVNYTVFDRKILLTTDPITNEYLASAESQQNRVTGKITDSETGAAMPGVNIIIKGTTVGSISDASGNFSVAVTDKNVTLIFSFIGYTNMEVPLAGQSVLDVALIPELASLTEVVVIGYGTARKTDLTGSVTSIKVNDLSKNIVISPGALFQDKVVGMEVTNTSGMPGAAPTIQIRGTSSIRAGNNPLYVVDGVPLDGTSISPSMGNAFGTTPDSDPLLFINSTDIAQIDVLKDASSTAIYGSRGANGVVLITTKKGITGPMQLEVGFSTSFNSGYMKRFEILDANQFRSALSKYLSDDLVAEYDGGENTDALKAITQNKISTNASFALTGGNDNGRFRASFLTSNNNGFLTNSALKKYLGSFNGEYSFFDKKLTLGFIINIAKYGSSGVSIGQTSGNNGNLLISALEWNPTQPLMKNGSFNYPTTGGSGHPLAFSEAYSDLSNVTEVLSNFSASYKITPKLTYKLIYGINGGSGERRINTEGWLPNFQNVSGLGNAAINAQALSTEIVSNTLNYKTNISENWTAEALIGYEYMRTDFSGSSMSARQFNFNLVYEDRIGIPYTSIMQNAKTQYPYTTWANPTSELQSFFGRATFNFKDKYLLTATLRADGSSKFGADNKYGYFPSAGFKWQISKENFMSGSTVLTNLSLRLSYGITGNQEFPAGSALEQFSLVSYNTAPQIVNGNPDLKWETTKQSNMGLDFAFGRGKVWGSVDLYNKVTSDIIFQTIAIQPAPSSSTFMNLPDALLTNRGIEVALGTSLIDDAKINWEITGNVAYNRNKITEFTDPNTGLDIFIPTGTLSGQGLSGTLAQAITNNQPVNIFYLKKFSGFDANGNQIIEPNPDFAGDPNPHVLVGFGTSVRYSKFTLAIRMGGAFGYLIYNTTRTAITNIAGIGMGRNIDEAAYNSKEGVQSGVSASTRFLESGNYLKLRTATISYNIGNIGKYFKNCYAFVNGNNLFVISKFTGFDPEVNVDEASGGYPSRSIEYVPYPTARYISLGLNFSL